MPTHRIMSTPGINDILPGRIQRWWKLLWYLKPFDRRVGADYKVEEECNECQQKAAMGKHFVKPMFFFCCCC